MNSIKKIFAKVMPNAEIRDIKDMSKGIVNKVYSVDVFNNKTQLEEGFILRIFPGDGWKADKEKYLYNLLKRKTDVPVPDVVLVDNSKKLINKSYSIMKRIPGKELGDKKGTELIKEAGVMLAKIHSIKFNNFGWIVGRKIDPKFSRWVDFLEFDLSHKLGKLGNSVSKKFKEDIKYYFDAKKDLFDIDIIPSLLHKDFSYAHVIVDKKINGIIDLEWAIAGHNEIDIVKSLLWMFEKDKKRERIFLNGYKTEGSISKDFEKRKEAYELLIFVSSLAFAKQCKSGKWCRYNLKKIKGILYG